MAFVMGFKKEAASAAREVGRAAGKVISAPFKSVGAIAHHGAKAVGSTAKGFGEGVSAGFPVKRLSPWGRPKPVHGSGLANKRVANADKKHQLKLTPDTERQNAKVKAKEDIKARGERMKHKPMSLNKKLVLGLGGYVGYKALTSPSDNSQQAQVYTQ